MEKPWWSGVDRSKSGNKSQPTETAAYAWFSPVDAPELRLRYVVIKEEGDLLSIQPGEGRFKTGLFALRWTDQREGTSRKYRVAKTKPTRIDLTLVPA